MPRTDDSDPVLDWEENAKTTLDETVVATSDPVTAPHDLRALAASPEAVSAEALDARFRAVYAEGQEDVIGALRSLMFEAGAANDEVAATIRRLRGRLTKL